MRAIRTILAVSLTAASFGLMQVKSVQAASEPLQANQYEVTAVVAEKRIIVIDGAQKIRQIISNTNKDITPVVVYLKPEGPGLPLSAPVARHYQDILNGMRSNHIGTITRLSPSFSDLIPNFVKLTSSVTFTASFRVMPVQISSNQTEEAYDIDIK